MLYLLGLVFLIVGLLISVALHELGHLIPAKCFQVIVPEYWVGFGPKLFSKTIRGTTYGLKLILLGGYVQILGMFPPQSSLNQRGSKLRHKWNLKLLSQVREQSEREVEEARKKGATGKALWQVAPWKKLVIIACGPLVNLVLGFVLIGAVLVYGSEEPTTTIASVYNQEGYSSSAYDAGILPADTIVAIDSTPIEEWQEVRDAVSNSGGSTLEITVLRQGNSVVVEATPTLIGESYSLGISAQTARVPGNFTDSFSVTGSYLYLTVKAITHLPATLWDTVTATLSGEERSADSAVSIVGVARVAGEIASYDGYSTSATQALVERLVNLTSILASLNLALFVFNLIPLPPLDGGHMVTALWGMVKNGVAKLTGRKAYPVDTAKLMPLTYAVFSVFIALTVILVLADLINPISLFG